MTFGEWIIIQLEEVGKSQYRFEIDSNFTKGTLYRWSCKAWPRLDSFLISIDTLVKYTGRTPEELIIQVMKEVKR